MSARAWSAAACALLLAACTHGAPRVQPTLGASPAQWAAACADWDDWARPAPPTRIHGNTWYVGTCGISTILVIGDEGAVLIDSGTAPGAEVVLANLRTLGIAPGEVKLLLHSHEHFDHGGGMARLHEATGATLVASGPARPVLETGEASADDPQAGMHAPMEPVPVGMVVDAGDTVRLGDLAFTPVPTPGHTSGALSWTWRSCEGDDCRTLVYADSLSAVSRDGYRFSEHPERLRAFRASIARLASLPCDMLLTPHPSGSGMIANARSGRAGGDRSCAAYARAAGEQLDERLAEEAARP